MAGSDFEESLHQARVQTRKVMIGKMALIVRRRHIHHRMVNKSVRIKRRNYNWMSWAWKVFLKSVLTWMKLIKRSHKDWNWSKQHHFILFMIVLECDPLVLKIWDESYS